LLITQQLCVVFSTGQFHFAGEKHADSMTCVAASFLVQLAEKLSLSAKELRAARATKNRIPQGLKPSSLSASNAALKRRSSTALHAYVRPQLSEPRGQKLFDCKGRQENFGKRRLCRNPTFFH
jgi:hypothetical protein